MGSEMCIRDSFIIVMLPIGILTSYVLWKKGKIQVVDKEQK
mgnify:FL=1